MEARSYQEPALNILLPLASLFPALHLVAYVFELVKSCGLVGQIFVGIIWGEPLTSWLGLDYQNAISSLGYIGLISLVYEGKAPIFGINHRGRKDGIEVTEAKFHPLCPRRGHWSHLSLCSVVPPHSDFYN